MQKLKSKPDPSFYPVYTCPHLWWMINKEKLDGLAILNRLVEIQEWLTTTMGEYDENGFWHNQYGWFGQMTTVGSLEFLSAIWFKREEDLLAFKLRWGIHT